MTATTAAPAPAPTGPVTGRPCGHCATNYPDRHKHCPGAIENGARGELWICGCGCKPLTCVRCKTTDGVNPQTWTCFEADECAAAVDRRVAANPTIAMIRRITAAAHERIAAEKGIQRERSVTTAPVFRPGAGRCECGCGTSTGSRFAMGHDARLRSQLTNLFRNGGDVAAGDELAARGGVWAAKGSGRVFASDDEASAYVAARVAERLA